MLVCEYSYLTERIYALDSDSSIQNINPDKVVCGIRQTKKLIASNMAKYVFIAIDADAHIFNEINELCKRAGVKTDISYTKEQLGALCRLEVACAVASLEKE